MSAFMVSKEHIDALVSAGLELPTYGPLRWIWPAVGAEDQAACYQRGEPWGPEAVRLISERTHELTTDQAERVGAMLWAENRRSIDFRYNEEEWEDVYTFRRQLIGYVNPVVVLKAISCLRYQSCEHPEWEQSEAFTFLAALEQAAIDRLPGMNDAPGWEVQSVKQLAWRPKVKV